MIIFVQDSILPTEETDSNGNASYLYTGGGGFEFCPGHQLSRVFHGCPPSLKANAGIVY
jgi:hypothetical protein